MPAPSWPSTDGSGDNRVPFTTDRSEWQTPDAPMRTRTSPAFGVFEPDVDDFERLVDRRDTQRPWA